MFIIYVFYDILYKVEECGYGMSESYWGMFVVFLAIFALFFIYFFQSVTNTDEHNYFILKETTEAAMIDAIDMATYREQGLLRIDREKFVENFVRRFAQNANLSRDYKIEIYDINERPPKVSLLLKSSEGTTMTGEVINFDIVNRIDAILETPF